MVNDFAGALWIHRAYERGAEASADAAVWQVWSANTFDGIGVRATFGKKLGQGVSVNCRLRHRTT